MYSRYSQKVYRKIRDRKVAEVVKSLEYNLGMLRPNASAVHRIGNLKYIFYGVNNLFQKGLLPKNETFMKLKKRNKKVFNELMRNIEKAARYNIQI